MRSSHPLMRKLFALTVAVTAATAGAVACATPDSDTSAEQQASQFAYQIPGSVSTINAGSDVGVSEFAQMVSGRVYPGVFVAGPSGQMIPNTDLVRTQALPGAQRIVQYQLAPEAVFSDGAPVTCTDYLLTFTAGKNPEIFGSHMPLFDDAERLNCQPGAKNFDVVFAEGRGARWRELFGPGTVMPAHAVASRVNMDEAGLNAELNSGNPESLRRIAKEWHDGFNLDTFDPAMHVSFGPYVLDSVGEAGQVTLVANEHYYGDAPLTDEIVVWPGTADSAELHATGNLRIADVSEADPQWLDRNAEGNALDVTSTEGALTDSLTFEDFGPWSYHERRRALAKCVDPRAVAAASSAEAGVEVPATTVHVVAHNDPLAKRFDDIAAPHMDVDVEGARSLAGLELRIGYAQASTRMAAMVEAIRDSCEAAGVTVTDVTATTRETKTLRDIGRVEIDEWGAETGVEGTVDAVLRPVNPQTEYGGLGARTPDVDAMREAETKLWETLPSLPLAAQPRSFAIDRNLTNVIVYTGPTGIGWNMDRWQLRPPSTDATTQ